MPWVELTDQPSLSYSNMTGFFGTRKFAVWQVDRSVITNAPQSVIKLHGGLTVGDNQGLPAFDSEWPYADRDVNAIALLDDYSIEQVGTHLLVTALYTDRRARNSFSSTFQTQVQQIPYQIKTPVLGVTPTVQTVATYRWNDQTFPVFSTLVRFQLVKYFHLDQVGTARVGDAGYYMDTFESIARQTNKLHKFDPAGGNDSTISSWFRFEGGDVRQLTWDRFQCTYAWVHDSGSPYNTRNLFVPPGIDAGQIGESINFPRIRSTLVDNGAEYFRAPFEQTIPCADPEFFTRATDDAFLSDFVIHPRKKVFVSRLLYDREDPYGYVHLPGM